MTDDIVHTGKAIRILDAFVERATDVPGDVLQSICLVCERLEHYERKENLVKKYQRDAMRIIEMRVSQANPFLLPPKRPFLRPAVEEQMEKMVASGMISESERLQMRANRQKDGRLQGKSFECVYIDELAEVDHD